MRVGEVLIGLLAGLGAYGFGRAVLDPAIMAFPSPIGKIRPSLLKAVGSTVIVGVITWRIERRLFLLGYGLGSLVPAGIQFALDVKRLGGVG